MDIASYSETTDQRCRSVTLGEWARLPGHGGIRIMAIRKCGRVKIQCKLVPAPSMPHGEQYKCILSIGGRHKSTQYVGIPRHLSHAIDSAQAYSAAAHAAISFAMQEGILDEADVEFTESGYQIKPAARRS